MNFEEQEEEMEMSGVNPAGGYDSLSGEGATSSGGGGGGRRKSVGGKIRYRECLKNHAVNIGGHAVDGCCEFMPSGEDGSLDALKCAACGCHRNFHRKETEIMSGRAHRVPTYYNRPPQLPPPGYLHLTSQAAGGQPYRPPAASADEEDTSNPSSSGGTAAKRFRTKFTAEQKEKMLAFAERLGWRIQKHDDAAVEQFCAETGVRRQVLKIWMHNNKNSLENDERGMNSHLSPSYHYLTKTHRLTRPPLFPFMFTFSIELRFETSHSFVSFTSRHNPH